MTQAVKARIDELASDIGRLRRRHPDDHIIDRAIGHIESIVLMLEPSAGQLAAMTAPGDDTAVTEAIRIRDTRIHSLHHLLGKRPT